MTRRPSSPTRGILLIGLAFAAGACSRHRDATGTTGQLQIAVTGGALSLTAGGSASASLAIVRPSGFTGAVQVSAESAPAGVTASPLTIAPGQTTGTLVLAASSAATPTTATITIRATGENVTAATASLSLTVQPQPPAASFTLSLSGPISITLGGTASVGLTITRVNLSQTINLSATGGLAGLGVAFDPAAVTGTTSTIRLTAGASLLPGIYPVTIRGSAAGAADQTVTLNVTLTVPVVVGSFSLSLGSASISLVQGVSATVTALINRTNLSAPVTLTVTGQPAGLGVTVSPDTTTGDQATITLSPAAALAVGAYTLTVRANAPGLAEQTATLAVSVALPASIDLLLDNVSGSLIQGLSLTRQLTVVRTNYVGTVNLAAVGLPAGLDVTFNPPVLAGPATTSTVTITANPTLSIGAHAFTIRASGNGIAERSIGLTLSVSAPLTAFTFSPLGCSYISQTPGASVTDNLLRINRMSFTGPVTFTATGQPPGMNVTINPATTTGDQVQVTITLDGTVATGDHTLTFHGSAPGTVEQTVTYGVSVDSPTSSRSLQIALAPNALSLAVGSSGNTTVTVTRPVGHFCLPVQVSAEGVPPGVTIAPVTIGVGQHTGTLGIQAGLLATLGAAGVAIRANGSSMNPGSATLSLTVQPPDP